MPSLRKNKLPRDKQSLRLRQKGPRYSRSLNKITLSGKIPKKSQEIIKDLPFVKLIYASVLVNVAIIVFVILVKNQLPPEVPLFYGLPRSEAQLATSNNLVLPSVISLSIIAVNSVLSYLTKDDFLKKTLVATGLASTFFAAVTTLKIIFLVGSL